MPASASAPEFIEGPSASTFLERVLPWEDADGWLNVEWKSADGRWRRQSFKHIAAMLGAIERLKRHSDVYVCMSSQAVKDQRSVANARFRKSLSLDVDVKAGCFSTPIEALQALNMFRGAVGLPRPTLFVMTAGFAGGFHCHWILDRAIAKAEWLPLAEALKEAAKRHKFTVDMTVIADAARVLRIPDTTNFKYADRPPVLLYPSIVERDYSVDEIAGPLAPYMKARATMARIGAAATAAPRITMSKVWDGMDLSENDDLTAGLFSFAEFKDAVELLTRKGWFDEHKYDHMLGLAFACGYVEITERAHTDDARALYGAVVDATGRDPVRNERRYADGLERTRARIRAGGEIITPGTIFIWAREQGRAPETAAPPTGQSPGLRAAPERHGAHAQGRAAQGDAYKVAKSRLYDAFLIAQKLGRRRIRNHLVREALTVTDMSVRSKLTFALAAFLMKSNHSPEEIVDAVVTCGFSRSASLNVLAWARKNVAKGEAA